jgi:hypothetical protein
MTVANAPTVNSGLTKGTRRLIRSGGSAGNDWFEYLAQRLVQPAQRGGAEAARQWCAGGGHELADLCQAEAVQGGYGVVGEARARG